MSKTIELPDPLFAEIDVYATRTATSPLLVLNQAWREFHQRHAQESVASAAKDSRQARLLAMVRSLKGSISLPSGVDDDTLITEARLEKYGPL